MRFGWRALQLMRESVRRPTVRTVTIVAGTGSHILAASMGTRLSVTCAIALIAAACDSARVPSEINSGDPIHTLVVTDGGCLFSPCGPLEVGGWPESFVLPCPSTGCALAFDTIAGPAACVRIPAQLSVFVSEVGLTGLVVHVDTLRWTPQDPIRLMVRRLGEPRSYTQPIVPGTSAGWSLTVSGTSAGRLAPSPRCPL